VSVKSVPLQQSQAEGDFDDDGEYFYSEDEDDDEEDEEEEEEAKTADTCAYCTNVAANQNIFLQASKNTRLCYQKDKCQNAACPFAHELKQVYCRACGVSGDHGEGECASRHMHCGDCHTAGHSKGNIAVCGIDPSFVSGAKKTKSKGGYPVWACTSCGQVGHLLFACPSAKALFCQYHKKGGCINGRRCKYAHDKKEVVCRTCGVIGDHSEVDCANVKMKCTKCNMSGHHRFNEAFCKAKEKMKKVKTPAGFYIWQAK